MLQIQHNISLKTYNTFGVEAKATSFVELFNEADLHELFSSDVLKQERFLILGGGSNMLFTKDFKGLVVKISMTGIGAKTAGDHVFVTAGAGEVWNDLVTYCVKNGFAGLENLTLIPGTVGASPVQNIGAYGVELKDVFSSCSAFELATGKTKIFNYEDCQFDYRESIFKGALKGKFIITSVTFKLSAEAKINTSYGAIESELERRKINQPTILDVSAAVAHIRVSKLPDPSTIGNAGSFFKNPIIGKDTFNLILANHPSIVAYPMPDERIKLAAGWLIEQCGFKGKIVGNTGSWKNQALVLVNHGGASGTEIYDYSQQIVDSVHTKFGVTLSREVNIL
ncbi:UDP-N-acetylmuramate dehydrogenase [Pedobacter sp. UYP30]|uniref:UDP-N-acetylmuramate dehydrogenase n=1 Tax=Pedobacter sp. UYP30 TaxID=1756400 RepID=UPI00339530A6